MSRTGAYAALFTATLLVSTAAPFIELAHMDAYALVLLRMGLAAPLFLAWAAVRGSARLPAEHRRSVLLGGALLAAHFLLWVKAFDLTSYASNLLLLIAQPVIAVPLGARIGERPTRTMAAAVALALGGLALIAGGDVRLGGRALVGDGLCILAGLAITLFYVATRRARATMPVAAFMGWTTLSGAAAALPVVLLAGSEVTGIPAASWGWLAGLVLITTMGGHGLMNVAANHVRLFTVNIVIVLEPALGILAGVAFLGKGVTAVQIAGGAVLGAAVWIALLPEWRSHATSRSPPGFTPE